MTITRQSANDLTRMSNAVFYVSPSFGGLQVRAAFGAGTENFGDVAGQPASRSRVFGLSGEYRSGPLYVGAAYMLRRDADTAVATGDSLANTKFAVLGATYGIGIVSFNAGVSRLDPALDSATNGRTTAYWVGAGVSVGAGQVLAQYGQTRVDTTAATDPRARIYGVAYVHPVSKRTNLYAAYGTVRNSAGAAFNMDTGGNAVAAGGGLGSDPSAVAFGVRHTF